MVGLAIYDPLAAHTYAVTHEWIGLVDIGQPVDQRLRWRVGDVADGQPPGVLPA